MFVKVVLIEQNHTFAKFLCNARAVLRINYPKTAPECLMFTACQRPRPSRDPVDCSNCRHKPNLGRSPRGLGKSPRGEAQTDQQPDGKGRTRLLERGQTIQARALKK